MHAESAKLRQIVEQSKSRLLTITEQQADDKPHGEKWSLKEILGHLIDSEGNNRQRIVRMQEKPDVGTFQYSQEHWVATQQYRTESWNDLVLTWYYANLHLAHVIEHINASTLKNTCDTGDPEPTTLESVVTGYVRHLEHHINQIFSGADPRERSKWKEM
jgi:hypothetical protein